MKQETRMSCRKDCLNCDAENVKIGTCGYCHTDLCEECCREDFEDADSCCSNDAFDWCCKDCEEKNGEDEKVKCYGGCGYEFDDEELFDGDCECFNDQTKHCRKCDGCGICDNCWDSGKRIAGPNGEITTGRKFILKIKNGKVISKTQI